MPPRACPGLPRQPRSSLHRATQPFRGCNGFACSSAFWLRIVNNRKCQSQGSCCCQRLQGPACTVHLRNIVVERHCFCHHVEHLGEFVQEYIAVLPELAAPCSPGSDALSKVSCRNVSFAFSGASPTCVLRTLSPIGTAEVAAFKDIEIFSVHCGTR